MSLYFCISRYNIPLFDVMRCMFGRKKPTNLMKLKSNLRCGTSVGLAGLRHPQPPFETRLVGESDDALENFILKIQALLLCALDFLLFAGPDKKPLLGELSHFKSTPEQQLQEWRISSHHHSKNQEKRPSQPCIIHFPHFPYTD